jgi:hypothetical protein
LNARLLSEEKSSCLFLKTIQAIQHNKKIAENNSTFHGCPVTNAGRGNVKRGNIKMTAQTMQKPKARLLKFSALGIDEY